MKTNLIYISFEFFSSDVLWFEFHVAVSISISDVGIILGCTRMCSRHVTGFWLSSHLLPVLTSSKSGTSILEESLRKGIASSTKLTSTVYLPTVPFLHRFQICTIQHTAHVMKFYPKNVSCPAHAVSYCGGCKSTINKLTKESGQKACSQPQ